VTASPAKLRAENNDACPQVYSSSRDRHFRLCARGYYQEAAIKKRLKIDVSFYTILQILSLIIFKKIK